MVNGGGGGEARANLSDCQSVGGSDGSNGVSGSSSKSDCNGLSFGASTTVTDGLDYSLEDLYLGSIATTTTSPHNSSYTATTIATTMDQNLTDLLLLAGETATSSLPSSPIISSPEDSTGTGTLYNDYYNCMNHADNISYLNISCEFELEYATPLYGYCIPFLVLVTVTANLLIVCVLSRRNMATPTNSVLMGE